ncbi:uncharacterized protein LOC118736532 [Rhagoletis pomonella]|uniref:uncharacterized protein LOC118736532 n=1 Tax=Rhagoletis pomonella TaxID=28610 RepID=UPI00177C0AB9|nr:uncharacterized protein LOC118736532 [Rhagoletis pomonella]
MRMRIFNDNVSTAEELRQPPTKLHICDGAEIECAPCDRSDALSLTASDGLVEAEGSNEYAGIVEEIERWLQGATTTTPGAWENQSGVDPLPAALVDDIEAHLQQPQQRRGRRSFRRDIDGNSYRVRISRTGTVTVSLIAESEGGV